MNTRREFLHTSGVGFGWLAFQALAHAEAGSPLAVKQTHFNATAKRVIFLCMRGAPSHVDTFDYKPKLTAASGKDGRAPSTKLQGSQWKFYRRAGAGCRSANCFRISRSVRMICASSIRCTPSCPRMRSHF